MHENHNSTFKNTSIETDKLRLGVNIDHVATLRNARGGSHPDPIKAAQIAQESGADGITAHLREDRRHISDKDIFRLKNEITVPLNLEMAPTEEMLRIAVNHQPHAVCLVPEKRQELTTEGGLNVLSNFSDLTPYVNRLKKSKLLVSMFIDPELEQVRACADLGSSIVEFHVGAFCDANSRNRDKEFNRILRAVREAEKLGLECHAGHGLTFENVGEIAKIKNIVELNIGHFLIGEGLFSGLNNSIKEMRKIIDIAREKGFD